MMEFKLLKCLGKRRIILLSQAFHAHPRMRFGESGTVRGTAATLLRGHGSELGATEPSGEKASAEHAAKRSAVTVEVWTREDEG